MYNRTRYVDVSEAVYIAALSININKNMIHIFAWHAMFYFSSHQEIIHHAMMTSRHESTVPMIGPLWMESTVHRWSPRVPSLRASNAELWCLLCFVSMNKLLNIRSSCWWFEKQRHPCDCHLMCYKIRPADRYKSMARCKTAAYPLLTRLRYCSLALSHRKN